MWKVTAVILRRFSAQEHDTDRTVPVSALLWDVSFTKYICVYFYITQLGRDCSIFSVLYSESYI